MWCGTIKKPVRSVRADRFIIYIKQCSTRPHFKGFITKLEPDSISVHENPWDINVRTFNNVEEAEQFINFSVTPPNVHPSYKFTILPYPKLLWVICHRNLGGVEEYMDIRGSKAFINKTIKDCDVYLSEKEAQKKADRYPALYIKSITRDDYYRACNYTE